MVAAFNGGRVGRRQGLLVFLKMLIATRQQSCDKVMFSQVCVCSKERVYLVPGPFQGVGNSGPSSLPGLSISGPRSFSGIGMPRG